jgi:hypothetical protein
MAMLVVTTNDIPGWEIQRVGGEVFARQSHDQPQAAQPGYGQPQAHPQGYQQPQQGYPPR